MGKSKRDRALARAKTRAAAREEKARAKLRDVGPDPGGNYSVNPYAARGHIVEVAPKELRDNPNSTQFPKRIATQRMIDRYLAHGHISDAEWKAADAMWQAWLHAGLEARVCAGYDPDAVSGGRVSTDGIVAARIDGAAAMEHLLAQMPARCRGVVRAVVIEDISASDWARERGYGERASKSHGLARLSQGLSALAQHLGH
jgi:DNA-directed RNA polymerase specialized sigma24 family protein